jgi:hypothetical protein
LVIQSYLLGLDLHKPWTFELLGFTCNWGCFHPKGELHASQSSTNRPQRIVDLLQISGLSHRLCYRQEMLLQNSSALWVPMHNQASVQWLTSCTPDNCFLTCIRQSGNTLLHCLVCTCRNSTKSNRNVEKVRGGHQWVA